MFKPGNKLIVLVLLFLAPAMMFALPQVAVLDTILSAGMDPAVRSPVTDKIVEELVKCGKYRVLDRANVAQVLREKEFQLSSGLVGNAEIRRAGEYLGADLVVVASASRVGSTHVISVKMIDVLSGEITAQASEELKGTIDVLLQIARTAGQRIAGVAVTVRPATPTAAPAAPAAAPAATAPPTADAVLKLQVLIKSKVFLKPAGRAQMLQLASRLSESDKMYLYSTNTKDDAAIGLGLNLLLTSLGSWVQGDTAGALTEITMALAAIMAMTNGWDTYEDYWGYEVSEPNALFYLGVGCLVFNIVYMCARPFAWVKMWNRNLAQSLGVIYISVLDPEQSSFTLTPDQDNKWALKVNLLNVKY